MVSGRTEEEQQEILAARSKMYRTLNNDKLIISRRLYYEKNKNKILNSVKDYYRIHASTISIQKQIYYQQNKEQLNEKHREYYIRVKHDIALRKLENINTTNSPENAQPPLYDTIIN